jgi:hypothetical protein
MPGHHVPSGTFIVEKKSHDLPLNSHGQKLCQRVTRPHLKVWSHITRYPGAACCTASGQFVWFADHLSLASVVGVNGTGGHIWYYHGLRRLCALESVSHS